MYVHQGGQAYCADGHILLAILIEGDKTDLSNYLYVESTYDASTEDLGTNIQNYLNFSINTYKKSDTFHITNAPIDFIVISEYLNRNPLNMSVWLKYGKDILDHEIFNNILIFSPDISETERFGRIYTELAMFPNSSTIWAQYRTTIESLPKRIHKLKHEMAEGIKYKDNNAKQILTQYLQIPHGKDTEKINSHYMGIVEMTLKLFL